MSSYSPATIAVAVQHSNAALTYSLPGVFGSEGEDADGACVLPLCSLQVVAWYWPPVVMVAGIAALVGVYVTQAEPRGAPDISHHDLTVGGRSRYADARRLRNAAQLSSGVPQCAARGGVVTSNVQAPFCHLGVSWRRLNVHSVVVQAPFKLTSFALALLLVFRTNNTYDRSVCLRKWQHDVWLSAAQYSSCFPCVAR